MQNLSHDGCLNLDRYPVFQVAEHLGFDQGDCTAHDIQSQEQGKEHLQSGYFAAWILQIDIVDPAVDLRQCQTEERYGSGSQNQADNIIDGQELGNIDEEGQNDRLVFTQRLC